MRLTALARSYPVQSRDLPALEDVTDRLPDMGDLYDV